VGDDSRHRLAAAAGAPAPVIALDDLIDELTPVLWQVARAAGLGREDAEDVVQTTWESLLSHLNTIREPGALTAWLVTATRREEWLGAIPDPRENSEDRALLAEEQRAVWAALRTLPPRCQELLRIVAFVPRPDYDVVAARLGMARGSVGPTRGRCLDKLRGALGSGSWVEEEGYR
jgi:RNA polymerase sigma factor (sigma-70 family)